MKTIHRSFSSTLLFFVALMGLSTGPLVVAAPPNAPASGNDLFENRWTITAPAYHGEGSMFGTTNELGEPLPAPNFNQTVWWSFTAPEQGTIRLLAGTGFNSKLTMYEGTEFDTMLALPEVTAGLFSVEGGHQYSVQLASDNAASGSFTLDGQFFSATNDMFAGSTRLEGSNIVYYGSFALATPETNEPASYAPDTVWVSWTAPFTGRANFNRPDNWQDTQVFTGPTVDQLTPVRLTGYSFAAVAGTAYHFQFSGSYYFFTFTLQEDPFLLASNDNFADALLVTGQMISFDSKSMVGATMETGEPLHMGETAQKSLWWKWQAPFHGHLSMSASGSLITNIVLGVYQGPAVEALLLVGKATNQLTLPVLGGEWYYFAAAALADEIGDVVLSASLAFDPGPIPSNLLQEPSWEGTGLNPLYWHVSGQLGGYVDEYGGADGMTWPVLGTGTRISQDFPTVPGHQYRLCFAYRIGGNLSSCCGIAGVLTSWDSEELGLLEFPDSEYWYWHWGEYIELASNTTSRITFENIHRNLEMDAFSVVDLSAPPVITTQPSSSSTVSGGTAAFIVGVYGSAPLNYQWFFNAAPLSGQTGQILLLRSVAAAQAGGYSVIVSNNFGAVTSLVATLVVDAPTNATIVFQPYGDTVPEGHYFNLSVVAIGAPPLIYQWLFNGSPLADATNHNLTFTNVFLTNAGRYEVLVQNSAGGVWSLPANLVVTNAVNGGGTIDFQNRVIPVGQGQPPAAAPVFDIDGVTLLASNTYVAQLYAGPSIEGLRAAGSPTPFRTNFSAGYFVHQVLTLPNVPPWGVALAQVRVWESERGSSYEEARALGSKFGHSEILSVLTGGQPPGPIPPTAPGPLAGLSSFSLSAGLPQFTVGSIQFLQRAPGGQIVWALHGEAGYRYTIEKSAQHSSSIWRPYVVVTNLTGTVTFTDSADSGSSPVFYRARILD